MIPRFKLSFVWAFAITLFAAIASLARSVYIVLGTLYPRNDRSEGNTTNISAQGATPLDLSVSLHALMDKLNVNSLFNLG